ncbi:hypothetical protein PISL3812_08381 [Talaromyces islandicus]|uniref:Zn(2)-C6 fungal-type domain-containing protein n=1 Tax=Talaromyces islandicus TaxID=28573 RepID=A0A0U1M6U1_TALIS|nr:hypothetical protein PISL3812_08381 [Talaromyces islandicus]
MVKVAFAGGSGNVAQEIIDVLVAQKKHDVLILSRKDSPAEEPINGVTWVKADYGNLMQLEQVLQGVHTLLSFVTTQDDPFSNVQKNLIDAAIKAGVKRFAPSEWSTSQLEHLSWYTYKAETRRYLKEVNKDKKVLEYSLFQPGLFVNYFTYPYNSATHIHPMELPFDFNNRRAILLDGGDDNALTLTTVQDLAIVVARAIDFQGEWPIIGGIKGTTTSIKKLIALGEKIRGGTSFATEKVKAQDLESGTWTTSWQPQLDHPSIPAEQADIFSRIILAGVLLALSADAYTVSDEWNKLLPDYKFTQAEDFLTQAWHAKRRKVRKGTQSCWECKRRKVRCIFASDANTICDNCRRRGTACISQELPDQPATLVNSNQQVIEARLGRVEELVEQLVSNTVQFSTEALRDIRSISTVPEDRGKNPFKAVSPTRKSTTPTSLKPKPPVIGTSQAVGKRSSSKYEEVSHDLISAWPNESDLDLLWTLPVGLSTQFHCGACTLYSKFMENDSLSLREVLKLPQPASHPVLIARKLLILGTYLQGIPPSSIEKLGDLGASYRDIMSRVVDSATRLVTTNDGLVRSVEGVECILLEAMYHNYAGNLHRAWMAVRRATSVAQMMMLHRGLKSSSLNFIEPETRANFSPENICLRLLEMDCYLSLMLGLPQASLESNFTNAKALEACHPIDRVQRIHCDVSGQILHRNDADANDLEKTQKIDQILQKAAAEVPPQWWLVPDFVSSNHDNPTLLCDTIRLMDQFTHYHLLIRLHLPFMLRSSSDNVYDHSRIIAMNASREILSRYVVFRTSNPAHFYCRGTDFLAFIATTVICLAHIDSHRQNLRRPAGPIFNFLAHSRPGDRGIMEHTLEIIDSMARSGTDAIASKLGYIIHHLLTIEANAANGTIYMTSSSNADGEEPECHAKLSDGGRTMHIYIPYFGTINFEGGAISKSASVAPKQGFSLELDPQYSSLPDEPSGSYSNNTELSAPSELLGVEYDWDLDMALFDSLFRGAEIPEGVEEQLWQQ